MDQGLNQKIDAYIAENKEQLLQDIAALVAIDSVEGTPEEGAPFGKGPRAALDKTLELAAGMGLATRNCENYMGYAELAGADPEIAPKNILASTVTFPRPPAVCPVKVFAILTDE